MSDAPQTNSSKMSEGGDQLIRAHFILEGKLVDGLCRHGFTGTFHSHFRILSGSCPVFSAQKRERNVDH